MPFNPCLLRRYVFEDALAQSTAYSPASKVATLNKESLSLACAVRGWAADLAQVCTAQVQSSEVALHRLHSCILIQFSIMVHATVNGMPWYASMLKSDYSSQSRQSPMLPAGQSVRQHLVITLFAALCLCKASHRAPDTMPVGHFVSCC